MSTITGIEEPSEMEISRRGPYSCLSEVFNENWKLIDIVEYLNSKHGLVGQERWWLINKVYKGLLNHFIPDYMKLVLHEVGSMEDGPTPLMTEAEKEIGINPVQKIQIVQCGQ